MSELGNSNRLRDLFTLTAASNLIYIFKKKTWFPVPERNVFLAII